MAMGLVVLVAAASGLVAGAAPAAAATTDGAAETELVRLTNDDRAAAGLAALAHDPAASDVARAWATSMADRGELQHNPDVVAQVEAAVTPDWARIGENVGYGPRPGAIQDAFMASAGHRDNVLGRYNRVGVGAVRDEGGVLWVAVVFLEGPAIGTAAPAPSAPWAPFASPEAFAEQQYRDFLGRPGDAAGVGHWASRLRAGTSGAAVVEAFLGSSEFGGVMAPVVRLYLGAFGRVPDQAGLQSWLDARRGGASLGAIADAFASSAEFRDRYDAADHRAFVDALHRSVFGRPADPVALAHWAGELERGRLTRGGVLLGLTAADELVWVSASEVSTTMAYVGLLRRTPDADGFAYWVAQLDGGRPVTDLLGAQLSSVEYGARF
jgi:hypothetical protein